MPTIEVTRQARDELRALIETCGLPADTRERVSRSSRVLERFPRAGKQLASVARLPRRHRPWGWLIVAYMYIEAENRVIVIAFHDARTSEAATAGS